MIDFDLRKSPGRPGEWRGLVDAVIASAEPEESYWLEMKSSLDWSTSTGVGHLARAIIGLANRDPDRAAAFLGGSGVVIVGVSAGTTHHVEVLDPADLENKLAPYLGTDGPRWSPMWVPTNDNTVLVVEVDAPAKGDRPHTLRAKFGDYRISQMFVREIGKTVLASEADVERLARRMTAPTVADVLDIEVGYSLSAPLSSVSIDDASIELFLMEERTRLLGALEASEPTQMSGGVVSARTQSMLDQVSRTIPSMMTERHEEKRSVKEYTAEVATYLQKLRNALPEALRKIAPMVATFPEFWLSNRSDRNFKDVEVTLRVEGDAEAADVETDDVILRDLLPKAPRVFGPYTTAGPLAQMLAQPTFDYAQYASPSLNSNWIPGRREIRNGGSFELDLDAVDLRPRVQRLTVEFDTVILTPASRAEPVLVRWHATASNVDAVADGEFVLPFTGEPIDLLKAGLAMKRVE